MGKGKAKSSNKKSHAVKVANRTALVYGGAAILVVVVGVRTILATMDLEIPNVDIELLMTAVTGGALALEFSLLLLYAMTVRAGGKHDAEQDQKFNEFLNKAESLSGGAATGAPVENETFQEIKDELKKNNEHMVTLVNAFNGDGQSGESTFSRSIQNAMEPTVKTLEQTNANLNNGLLSKMGELTQSVSESNKQTTQSLEEYYSGLKEGLSQLNERNKLLADQFEELKGVTKKLSSFAEGDLETSYQDFKDMTNTANDIITQLQMNEKMIENHSAEVKDLTRTLYDKIDKDVEARVSQELQKHKKEIRNTLLQIFEQ